MPEGMPIMETLRLHISHLSLADAPLIFELLNDEAWIRFIGDRNIHSMDDARGYIANGPAKSYRINGFGLYLVSLKEDGTPIGMSGLIKRAGLDHVDIGYAFLPRYRGKGYAIEAADAVLQYAREEIGLKRVVAITTPDNEASIHVLLKAGLQFEKMIRLSPDEAELNLFGINF